MLKTSSIESTKPKKGGVGVGGDNRVERDGMDDVEVDGDKFGDNEIGKKD